MSISKSEFKQLPKEQIKEGVTRSVVYTKNLMMAIIDFNTGPWVDPEPFHFHPHEQIAYVAKGEIVFYCEGRPEEHLKEGNVYAVPSGKKHTVKLLTKEVRLIDSFTPIREDFLK